MDDLEREKLAVQEVDKNIRNPRVYEELAAGSVSAAHILRTLLGSENDNVKLAAARDILDRTGWKPVEKKDITSGGMPISGPVLTDEQLIDIVNGFLKRTAIDVPGKEVGSPEGNIQPGS